MDDTKNRKLCLELAKADSQEEVVRILKKVGYWDDQTAWEDFDGNPNNYSTIGNQQSEPDAALVEKLVNSVDAVLMRECLRRGIDPIGPKAPKGIAAALVEFFGIFNGKLSNIDAATRTNLADNIQLVASGTKTAPSLTVVDRGEGQTPAMIPKTFLSLGKTNKFRTPFVQGKHNMGGTGALPFCANPHKLQLLVSRRDPAIADSKVDDSAELWGITVIRRVEPYGGRKSSSFKFLVPRGKILSFRAPSMPLMPSRHPEPLGEELEFGTFIKLYNYRISKYRTNILFDLYNRLSLMMPGIALPVRMIERRNYRGKSFESTLAGLNVRLDDDKMENVEPGYPSSAKLSVEGEHVDALIYAFKKGRREKYARTDGVVFSINGQSHGFLSHTFFKRKTVGMDYLADSILVVVDCSSLAGSTIEDLFMNSRDRLREDSPVKHEIERGLEELIKKHEGLRELRDRRRREAIEDKLKDSRPLAEVIEGILKRSPALEKFLLQGIVISNPFKLVDSKKEASKWRGKRFPTFFRVAKEFTYQKPKQCPVNRRFRIELETDAENEYFQREQEPGTATLTWDGQQVDNYQLSLWSGKANLTVELPEDVTVGATISYELSVSDDSQASPFINKWIVEVLKQEEKYSPDGPRIPRPKKHESHGLPNIIELYKSDNAWNTRFYSDTGALSVVSGGDGTFDFYINMENTSLLNELKNDTKTDEGVLKARYKFGMVLIGMSVLRYVESKKDERFISDNKEDTDNSRTIYDLCEAISPMLLPMIHGLGDIDV